MSIVLLDDQEPSGIVLNLLENGATALLSRHTSHEDFCKILHLVFGGYNIVAAEISGAALQTFVDHKHKFRLANEMLHDRELQVLKLAGKGLSNKEIAKELCISCNTVGTHFINISRKIGVQ